MSIAVKKIGFHLLGWLLLFGVVLVFISYAFEPHFLSILLNLSFWFFCFIYLSLFYLNAYLLIPKFYLTKNLFLYFAIILLLFIVVDWLQPFEQVVSSHRPSLRNDEPPFGPSPGPPGQRPPQFDIVSAVLFICIWSFSTAVQIIRQWRYTERRALQAEADKVNAELSFLKAQINPHFLFNTLNNIYSLSITKSEKTPDAILKLSNILRYITDDVRNDFVSLQSEVDCVCNYIELQKLRLTNKVDVQFNVEGNLEQKQIAPLLFMTFIENAFKYGISSHEACIIRISIAADEKSINLFCKNQVLVKELDEERTGVGISNAQKRLNYLYPQKYSLNIDTTDGQFIVHLSIVA